MQCAQWAKTADFGWFDEELKTRVLLFLNLNTAICRGDIISVFIRVIFFRKSILEHKNELKLVQCLWLKLEDIALYFCFNHFIRKSNYFFVLNWLSSMYGITNTLINIYYHAYFLLPTVFQWTNFWTSLLNLLNLNSR